MEILNKKIHSQSIGKYILSYLLLLKKSRNYVFVIAFPFTHINILKYDNNNYFELIIKSNNKNVTHKWELYIWKFLNTNQKWIQWLL